MTVMQTYSISAPSYRVEQWLAEAGLIQEATHKVVVVAPACLILCKSGDEQVRVKFGLADQGYDIVGEGIHFGAEEVWHDDIAERLIWLELDHVARVYSIFDVTLPPSGHQLWQAELQRRSRLDGLRWW